MLAEFTDHATGLPVAIDVHRVAAVYAKPVGGPVILGEDAQVPVTCIMLDRGTTFYVTGRVDETLERIKAEVQRGWLSTVHEFGSTISAG